MSRLIGLTDLLQDVVDRGTVAIQKVHGEISRRPFDLLEQVPPLDAPTRVVRRIHDFFLAQTYSSIRGTSRLVHLVTRAAIGAAEASQRAETEQ